MKGKVQTDKSQKMIPCSQQKVIGEMKSDIGNIKSTNEKLVRDILERIDLKFTGLKAEMIALHDIQCIKMDEMIRHQKETNGRVSENERNIRAFYSLSSEIIENQWLIRWVKKHPMKAILISLAIIWGLVSLTDHVSLTQII